MDLCVSVLSEISNIFEKFMQKQIVASKENNLSPYLCGYRKSLSSPQEKDYGHVSLQSDISNIFEKLMQKQIVGYIENILSAYLCWLRKKFKYTAKIVSFI